MSRALTFRPPLAQGTSKTAASAMMASLVARGLREYTPPTWAERVQYWRAREAFEAAWRKEGHGGVPTFFLGARA